MSTDRDATAPLADLGAGAAALVASLGAPVARATALTSLPGGPRIAYRLDLADGRTVKLRRAVSGARARIYTTLLSHLADDRLARVLDRRDDVTLEEWIDGAPLGGGEPARAHLESAAALLATIHRAPPPDDLTPSRDAAPAAREDIAASLDAVAAARALPPPSVARLREIAAARDPGVTPARIVHTDLCAENLVVDASGTLRAVDNEGLRIGAPGYDLARVRYRWPMSDRAWDAFVAAYARTADPSAALAHVDFWQLVALAHSARVRLRDGVAAAAVPLDRLARLLETR